MNIEELKSIKSNDLATNRLTYLAPTKSFGDYIRDELMWVLHFEEDDAVVFRCMDGKQHKIKKEALRFYHLVGR